MLVALRRAPRQNPADLGDGIGDLDPAPHCVDSTHPKRGEFAPPDTAVSEGEDDETEPASSIRELFDLKNVMPQSASVNSNFGLVGLGANFSGANGNDVGARIVSNTVHVYGVTDPGGGPCCRSTAVGPRGVSSDVVSRLCE